MSKKNIDWIKWVLISLFIIALIILIKILITGEPR